MQIPVLHLDDFLKENKMEQKKEVFDIALHDIKPLIEIQEYSLYYLIGVSVIGTVILLSLLYLAFKYFKNRKKFNIRKDNLSKLRAIDFSDAKSAAYAITTYGKTFKDDSDRHTRAYDALLDELENYKYKKDVENFSDETKHIFEIYLGLLDV